MTDYHYEAHVVSDEDLPMNPRLLGKPGVGKTTLAYAAGQAIDRFKQLLERFDTEYEQDVTRDPEGLNVKVGVGIQHHG